MLTYDAFLTYVLNEGEIIQKGTHDDLIHIDGYYKSLYEQQLLEKKINL